MHYQILVIDSMQGDGYYIINFSSRNYIALLILATCCIEAALHSISYIFKMPLCRLWFAVYAG